MAEVLPYGLSERKFALAYFWVRNKLHIQKGWHIFLFVFDAGLFLFISYAVVMLFFVQANTHQLLLDELATRPYVPYEAWHAAREPQPLKIVDVMILGGSDKRYDFVVSVENPNAAWMLRSIAYQFLSEGITGDVQQSFVYPEEKKYLYDLGVEIASRPKDVSFVIVKTEWLRVADFSEYFLPRYNFPVEDMSLMSVKTLKTSPTGGGVRLSFYGTNRTSFDFWRIGWTAVLKRGGKVTAVNYVELDNFISNEKRDVSLSFPRVFTTNVDIDIFPEVNIYDPTVFRPLSIRFHDEEEEEVKEIYSRGLPQ